MNAKINASPVGLRCAQIVEARAARFEKMKLFSMARALREAAKDIRSARHEAQKPVGFGAAVS